ncbi:MAG: hypothetical protein CMQ19_00230 [Gammaproteobacteria bacterium]|nr:hypothetical protein [Gammaproteobacteria bacterium]
MIITSHLAWHHLPKTAGTTTDRLFIASGLPLLWHDSQSSPIKHLPADDHPEAACLPLAGKQAVANFRRLPSWLLSNFQHKQTLMGLDIDAEPMRRGLFWRKRQQQWLPADWWLERFGIDDGWTLLRVEQLKTDFLACLAQHEPIGRRARWRVRFVQALNRNSYARDLSEWFTVDDLQVVYAANPRWAALEQRLYGHLLSSFGS